MTPNSNAPNSEAEAAGDPVRVRIRLPGGVVKDEIGLGSLLARMFAAAGVPPCADCEKRAEALDHLVVFSKENKEK
jgi:hypothetical protein